MLILTRRIGETLVIGDDVTVTVLGVRRNQVSLGINAPRDVEVHREEIKERIDAGLPKPEKRPTLSLHRPGRDGNVRRSI